MTNSGVFRCTAAYWTEPITSGEMTVAGDADDEQFAEAGAEDELRRHA